MPELNPEDQQKVNDFIHSNVNSVTRSPFRPMRLLVCLVVILVVFSGVAFLIASSHGVV